MPVPGSWLAFMLAFSVIDLASCPAQNAPSLEAPPLLPPYPQPESTPLGARIKQLLLDPVVARAHWGIAVTTLDGTPIFGLDEAKFFRPASTAKLFTTAAAMALLGPDTRFSTKIYGNLDPKTGIVHGDLILIGGGDPSFGTADIPYLPTPASSPGNTDLDSFAHELACKGVRRITGDIVGDDTLFATEGPPEGWEAGDLHLSYAALPSALSFADNELALTLHGGTARLVQLVPYMHLQNSVQVEPSTVEQPSEVAFSSVPGHPGTIHVAGTVAPDAPSITAHLSIPDPPRYAAEAFRSSLLRAGIQVSGQARSAHTDTYSPPSFLKSLRAPGGCETAILAAQLCDVDCPSNERLQPPLLEHKSPPLRDEITFTLKTSANLHAEVLLHELAPAFRDACLGTTTLEGARMLRAWLLSIGLPEHDFVLYDGSGLSNKDLVTPRAEAQLLAYAAAQPWFLQWKAALPVGGVDGTLAARFTEAPVKGQIVAKTGTLGESRALAGYIHCASGKDLIFSILVDNHEPGTAADRLIMDRIVAALVALN